MNGKKTQCIHNDVCKLLDENPNTFENVYCDGRDGECERYHGISEPHDCMVCCEICTPTKCLKANAARRKRDHRIITEVTENVLNKAVIELNKLYIEYSDGNSKESVRSAEYTDGATSALDIMEQRLETLRNEGAS